MEDILLTNPENNYTDKNYKIKSTENLSNINFIKNYLVDNNEH